MPIVFARVGGFFKSLMLGPKWRIVAPLSIGLLGFLILTTVLFIGQQTLCHAVKRMQGQADLVEVDSDNATAATFDNIRRNHSEFWSLFRPEKTLTNDTNYTDSNSTEPATTRPLSVAAGGFLGSTLTDAKECMRQLRRNRDTLDIIALITIFVTMLFVFVAVAASCSICVLRNANASNGSYNRSKPGHHRDSTDDDDDYLDQMLPRDPDDVLDSRSQRLGYSVSMRQDSEEFTKARLAVKPRCKGLCSLCHCRKNRISAGEAKNFGERYARDERFRQQQQQEKTMKNTISLKKLQSPFTLSDTEPPIVLTGRTEYFQEAKEEMDRIRAQSSIIVPHSERVVTANTAAVAHCYEDV
jgi:hypothetical protein